MSESPLLKNQFATGFVLGPINFLIKVMIKLLIFQIYIAIDNKIYTCIRQHTPNKKTQGTLDKSEF